MGTKSRAGVLGLHWGGNVCLPMEDAHIDRDTTPSHREPKTHETQHTAVLWVLYQRYGHGNLEEWSSSKWGCLSADCSKIKSSPGRRAWISELPSPFLCSKETCHKPSWKHTLLTPQTPTDSEAENLQVEAKWGEIFVAGTWQKQHMHWSNPPVVQPKYMPRNQPRWLTFRNWTTCHLAGVIPHWGIERIWSADGHGRGEVTYSCKNRRYQRQCSLIKVPLWANKKISVCWCKWGGLGMGQTGYGLFGKTQAKNPDPDEYSSALCLLLGWQKGVLVGHWEKGG